MIVDMIRSVLLGSKVLFFDASTLESDMQLKRDSHSFIPYSFRSRVGKIAISAFAGLICLPKNIVKHHEAK